MVCRICGGVVEWKGPLGALTHTECISCGVVNNWTRNMSSQQLPDNDPRIIAWNEYKETEEFKNTINWIQSEQYYLGALWTVFAKGYDYNNKELKTTSKTYQKRKKKYHHLQ